jgi:hypothetical protein
MTPAEQLIVWAKRRPPLTAPSPPARVNLTHMDVVRVQHWLEQARISVLSAKDDAEIAALITKVGERGV